MPYGKGTYGSTKGRPPKKKKPPMLAKDRLKAKPKRPMKKGRA